MSSLPLKVGRDTWTIQIEDDRLVKPARRVALDPPIADPVRAVKESLDRPCGVRFPISKAFTPEDHVAIVIDEGLPQLASLLTGVLEYLTVVGIAPEAVTLITPPGESRREWIDELPDELADVRTEVHNPADRNRLSYLATTKNGRRIYLNRTLVDADQSIILSRRGYDSLLGYSGAEAAIYPALADHEIRKGTLGQFSAEESGSKNNPLRAEAREVSALLGAPILIQVIETEGDQIGKVVTGLIDSSDAGIAALNDRYHLTVPGPVDVVIATIGGDPVRQDFATIARAAAVGARAVEEGGCVVILGETEPELSEGIELLRRMDDPAAAAKALVDKKPANYVALMQWVMAAMQTRLYLASGLQPALVEELFATPIVSPNEVQKLVDGAERCLWLPDAHRCWMG
jgi:nickel-dependent lactate racemase